MRYEHVGTFGGVPVVTLRGLPKDLVPDYSRSFIARLLVGHKLVEFREVPVVFMMDTRSPILQWEHGAEHMAVMSPEHFATLTLDPGDKTRVAKLVYTFKERLF